ncbi:FhuE receptor precursor [Lacunisphaera limnophila]|uniref:FhuE receptor n=1 Tax=Lacunisphaera limnophila TaxID=1838286 RepID=A0A1D8AVG7_9BACT|nr:TonB-dependent receptor plug domain-containing protein [Lacunisphaera limnophila]AOS44846.1 FhuE receptor precursor [Lacunisphaera limnophila]
MNPIESLRTVAGHPIALPRTRQGSSRRLLPSFLFAAAFAASSVHGQTAAADAAPAKEEEEILVLTPFEVTSGGENEGYTAATTLAGNRLNTELRDIGSAVTVVTKEFLQDVGATDNASLLQYTTGTEVGGLRGNFAGAGDAAQLNEDTVRPNDNTRVRGLAAADNTRDFFRSDVPWDSYNVDRVDLQRGANSILFGQGSPAGIINTGLKTAQFRNFGTAEVRVDNYGSTRGTLDINRVLLPRELALRVAVLAEDEKYRQKPAFSDDRRLYAALRYEPKSLNRDGLLTSLKANFEAGTIDSNNPRMLPPSDAITPWFTNLNQATYNQYAAFDHLSGRPNHGQFRVNLASTGARNPAYQHNIGTFGFPSGRAGPTVFMSGGNQSMMVTDVIGAFVSGGLGSDGSVDGGIAALPDNGWVSLQGTAQSAINNGEAYSKAGLWKNNLLTDASVFDFYNRLIDGDSKREWQDFNVLNLSASQTYFHNRAGISLDYSREGYENGQKAVLPGDVRLQVDPMAVYGDGSPDAGLAVGGEPFSNGTKNPNVGRAFVSSNNAWGNRSLDTDREALRATAFVQHDFKDKDNGWFRRVLGLHTLTALAGRETAKSDSRSWQRYGIFDNAYYNLSGRPDQRFNGALVPAQVIYLGDSLLGRSLSGANLPSISGSTTITSGSVRYFNPTWNSSVSPGAAWQNGFYLPGDPNRNSTQAENPANYVGWTTTQLNIVDAEASAANRDRLTTHAALDKAQTESQAFVWQGKWLDNALVSTIGWRKDIAESWAFDMSPNDFPVSQDRGAVNLSPTYYKLPTVGQRVEVQSRSYSLVAHLTDLPFLRGVTEKLPVNVSVYYNRSTNFKPDASRVDIYGEPLAAPAGKTIDQGIRVETKDGRYALRVNRYETSNSNANSTQINAASIGNWMQLTQNFANVFQYNIRPWGYDATAPGQTANATDVFDGAAGIWEPMRYNFHLFANRPLQPGEILSPDGSWIVSPPLEGRVLDAVRTFQRAVDPRFWTAWRINTFGNFGPSTSEVTYSVPTGFAVTEDNVSKGWEIELSAQPTQNWRLLLNASKTDARRTNIGNENMREFMDLVAASLVAPEGVRRLHHYWGTQDVVTAGKNWFDGEGLVGAPGSEWRLAQLVENTTVPEMREWRVNLISNYEFTEGLLKGLNVGGGLRYQSSVILGYPPMGNPNDPTTVEYDFAKPYRGPVETNIDLWVGYTRRLSEKLNWRIQLNVRDAFQNKGLIPITYQPNGTVAAYRIVSGQSFSLSNTFEF